MFKRYHRYSVLCNFAIEYLEEMVPENIDVEKYFMPLKSYSSMNLVFERLCETLQNKSQWPNSIKFKLRRDTISKILFEFDPYKVHWFYNEETLFNVFKQSFEIKNPNSPKNIWRQYSRYILSGSRFLIKFKTINEFRNFINSFYYNKLTKISLPVLIERKVKGLGFALSCDFLKEIGYQEYPKPDVHIKKIYSDLGFCDDEDYSSYKTITEMADVIGESAYKVNKVLWLISSGNFHLDENKVEGNRDELISNVKRLFNYMENIESNKIYEREIEEIVKYLNIFSRDYSDYMDTTLTNLDQELKRDFSNNTVLAKALLTAIFREEHFIGGMLSSRIESGVVKNLMEVILNNEIKGSR